MIRSRRLRFRRRPCLALRAVPQPYLRYSSCKPRAQRSSEETRGDVEQEDHDEEDEGGTISDPRNIGDEALRVGIPEVDGEGLGGVEQAPVIGIVDADAQTGGIDQRRGLAEDTARDEDDPGDQRGDRAWDDDVRDRLPSRRPQTHRGLAIRIGDAPQRLLGDPHEGGQIDDRQRQGAAERGEFPAEQIDEDEWPKESHDDRRDGRERLGAKDHDLAETSGFCILLQVDPAQERDRYREDQGQAEDIERIEDLRADPAAGRHLGTEVTAGGGIGPEIFNSFYILCLTLIFTVPIALLSGIYLQEYAKSGRFRQIVIFCAESLATVPSIVMGLFGLLVFVYLLGWKFSALGGALTLTVVNLPALMRVTQEALGSVPDTYREASMGLGATRWQTVVHVVIPSAVAPLITGIVLISGRIFGETAALIYTAGLSVSVNNPYDWSLFHTAETLAVHLWYTHSESLVPDVARIGNGSALVLLIMVLLFNIAARFLGRALSARFTGRVS